MLNVYATHPCRNNLTSLCFAATALAWAMATPVAEAQVVTATPVHIFTGVPDDGAGCQNDLTRGPDGALYGFCGAGGLSTPSRPFGLGTIYRLEPDGSYAVLHSFTGDAGYGPAGRPAFTPDGSLYGVAAGGAFNRGVLFRRTPDGQVTALHEFTGYAGGGFAGGGVTLANDGYLYGTTTRDGGGGGRSGTLYRIRPDGSAFQIIHRFRDGDGSEPATAPVLGLDGALYGVTSKGGAFNPHGVIYRVDPSGAFAVVHNFGGLRRGDGSQPRAELLVASDGYLYGTTFEGGAEDAGTVFRYQTGFGARTIYSFAADSPVGAKPAGRLIEGSDGLLYGTTSQGSFPLAGSVIQLRSNTSPTAQLGSFQGLNCEHRTGVTEGTDGALYVVCPAPDSNGRDALWRLSREAAR